MNETRHAGATAINPLPLSEDQLGLIDAYWRAANYLSVGQIYLLDNPLLREPLAPEHVKPRLLGHWGTTPGLNLIYAHLNRVIRNRDANVIFVTGPGHGGPGLVANAYLEGTYSEVYTGIEEDAEGLRKLFRQFSFPGGIPSHVAAQTPGSIHEGGELGYSLVHAYGAAFDNPDLVVACVVGDGEAETGPLAAELALQQVPQPGRRRRGAADPAPQRLQDRQSDCAGPHPACRAGVAAARLRLSADHRCRRRSGRRAPTACGRSRRRVRRHRGHPARRPQRRYNRTAGVADDRAAHPEGLDRAQSASTASRWRAPGGHIRSRSPRPGTTPPTARSSKTWLRSYAPEDLFDDNGGAARGATRAGTRRRTGG